MTALDRWIEAFITIVLIVGGYQFYFYCQRRTWVKARFLETRFDSMISYDPRWVWVYSGLYYPMMIIAGWSAPDWRSYSYVIGGFIALLAVQMMFFLFTPVAIPNWWRVKAVSDWEAKHGENTISQRFLDVVWRFDKLRNSMPSMHVSVATMVDLTIWSNWPLMGYIGGLFPVLIAISALKTKQHYVVDVIPGAAVGAIVFFAWRAMT